MQTARNQTLFPDIPEVAPARSRRNVRRRDVDSVYRAAVTTLPGGVVVIAPDGRVRECNPAALDVLGAPLLRERWTDVIARAFAPREDDGHEVSLKDGRRIRIAIQPMPDQRGQLVQLIDLTESRAWQETVAHQRRIYELGQMAASMAHQLRTPLATAMLYAGHLQRQELSVAQRQGFAGSLLERLQYMEQQIRALLLLARQELPMTDVLPLSRWYERVTESWPEVSVFMCPECAGFQLHCHAVAIEDALDNLIRNAVEATPAKGPVRVSFLCDGRELRLQVEDQGPGMDVQMLQRIDNPFFTTKSSGNGLGLALVRRIASAHGGTVEILSQLGIGTTVSLRLMLTEESRV